MHGVYNLRPIDATIFAILDGLKKRRRLASDVEACMHKYKTGCKSADDFPTNAHKSIKQQQFTWTAAKPSGRETEGCVEGSVPETICALAPAPAPVATPVAAETSATAPVRAPWEAETRVAISDMG